METVFNTKCFFFMFFNWSPNSKQVKSSEIGNLKANKSTMQ